MDRAEIVYNYKGDGLSIENALRFAIKDDYPAVYRARDVTGAYPITDPNAGVVYIEAETAVIDQIEADGWPILWREEIVEDII